MSDEDFAEYFAPLSKQARAKKQKEKKPREKYLKSY